MNTARGALHRLRKTWAAALGATAALLVIGLIGGAGLQPAQAAWLSKPIRPMAPKFTPVKKELNVFGAPKQAGAADVLKSFSGPKLSALEAFGIKPEGVPGYAEKHEQLWFLNLERKPIATAAAESSSVYKDLASWYSPAEALAAKRSAEIRLNAERAAKQYSELVGETKPLGPIAAASFTGDAHDMAQQLVVRLIHAALEDVPEPGLVNSPPLTKAVMAQRLKAALNRADQMGARPIGSRVWSDLLEPEFPREVYAPKARVVEGADAEVVDFVVRSPLLPSTTTPIRVGAYADGVVEAHREAVDKLLRILSPWGTAPSADNQFKFR